uniref:Uncharacterized protein n=1 Tax=Anguilla anguilla TaxID=7936 RepID=A0A0E9P8B6_ANGAN
MISLQSMWRFPSCKTRVWLFWPGYSKGSLYASLRIRRQP